MLRILQNIERPRSKFETFGAEVTDNLKQLEQSGESNVHWYQLEAVLKTKEFFLRRSPKKLSSPCLIVAPTGAGKSGIIVLLPYVLQSRKALVITPSRVISDQLGIAFGSPASPNSFFEISGLGGTETEKLKYLLEPARIIRGKDDFINEALGNLVIINAQKFGGKSSTTLSAVYRNEKIFEDIKQTFNDFDTLIIDEAHHYPAATWKRIVEEFSTPVGGMEKKIIFLTATPFRNDNGQQVPIIPLQHVAFEITKEHVQGTTTRELKFVEEANVTTLAADVERIFNTHKHQEPRHLNPQGLILVRTKLEAEDFASKLNEVLGNDFAVPITADTSHQKNLINFKEHNHRVAVTCGLLLEGYDNSNVTLCVILRNVKSRILFDQFIGRCVRKHKHKEQAQNSDQTVATVLSYKKYEQKLMWDEKDSLAQNDPIDDEVDVININMDIGKIPEKAEGVPPRKRRKRIRINDGQNERQL